MADDTKKKKKVDNTTGNRGEKPGKLGYFTEKSLAKFDPKNNPYLKKDGAPPSTKPDTIATEKPAAKPRPFQGGTSSYTPRAAARDTSPVGVPKSAPAKAKPSASKSGNSDSSKRAYYTKQRKDLQSKADKGDRDAAGKTGAIAEKLGYGGTAMHYGMEKNIGLRATKALEGANSAFNSVASGAGALAGLLLPGSRLKSAAQEALPAAQRALQNVEPELKRLGSGAVKKVEEAGSTAMKKLTSGKSGQNIRTKPGQPTYKVGNTATKAANKTAAKSVRKAPSRPAMPQRGSERKALNPSFGRSSGISQMDAIDMRKRAAAQGTKPLSRAKDAVARREQAEKTYQNRTMPNNAHIATSRENVAASEMSRSSSGKRWYGKASPATLQPAKRGFPEPAKPIKNVTPKPKPKLRPITTKVRHIDLQKLPEQMRPPTSKPKPRKPKAK